ncbi:MAG: hypothetical protein ACI9W2_003932 [Gammaproteobacteria bacterium]|jgi:hypothetical protein
MVAKENNSSAQVSSQGDILAPQEPLPSTQLDAPADASSNEATVSDDAGGSSELNEEFGGYKGPDPTRYGDWEHKGRCTDF